MEWPSPSFGPVSPDVLELLKRARQILSSDGFLLVDDPSNPIRDGRSWVLTYEPPSKVLTVAHSANSVRRLLESEGVRVDEVYKLDQHDFEVVLSPPSRHVTPVEVSRSEAERLQSERLRKGYQFNNAGSRIPSNQAIREEYRAAHNGEEPSLEYVMGEALKRAKESVHTAAPAEGRVAPPAESVKGSPPVKGLGLSPKGRASRIRAKLVTKVTHELSILKAEAAFEVDDDFDSARARFRGRRFYLFEAAKTFPGLKRRILTVKNFRRVKPIALAQEIVSTSKSVSLSTIKQDWKKYKPREFRSR
jgi:hypothetical protein